MNFKLIICVFVFLLILGFLCLRTDSSHHDNKNGLTMPSKAFEVWEHGWEQDRKN